MDGVDGVGETEGEAVGTLVASAGDPEPFAREVGGAAGPVGAAGAGRGAGTGGETEGGAGSGVVPGMLRGEGSRVFTPRPGGVGALGTADEPGLTPEGLSVGRVADPVVPVFGDVVSAFVEEVPGTGTGVAVLGGLPDMGPLESVATPAAP